MNETPIKSEPAAMPPWALVVLAILYCIAAFTFGLEVGRDMAIARPEFALGIDTYTKPVWIGSIAGAVAICIWLSFRKNQKQ